MLRSVSLSLALVPVGLALFACTPKTTSTDSGATGSGDDTGAADDTGSTGEVINTSIYDIQTRAVPEGSDVLLKGVILTADPASEGFFVQDAGGGEYSGIYVYMQSGLDDLFLAKGDEVDIVGYTVEFYDWTELTVTATSNIQVTGTGEVVTDAVRTDAVDDWEVWESCLISLGDVTVTAVDSYGEATVDDTIEIANLFVDFETEAGATYTDVVGLVSYEYEEWKINPRTADDLVGYVAGPDAPSATVYEVQTGVHPEKSEVKIEGAVVTSPLEEDGFYVQDAGGGEYSGVYVYVYGGTKGLSIDVGDVVTLEGAVDEYYDLTEITLGPDDIEVTGEGTGAPVVDRVNADVIADWEPWEGCLIQVGASEITESNGYGDYYLDNGLLMDNVFMDFDDGLEGATYASITGPLYYSYDEWRLLPRSNADLVAD